MKRNYVVSVLSHLFLVFSFSYFLGKLKNLSKSNMEKILIISLLHDIPEALTWDVITPTKKAAYGLPEALEKIEKLLVRENITSYFSSYKFHQEFEKIILSPFSSHIWKIAKYSDNLSAMFEAKIENTSEFTRIYKEIKNYLWEKNDKYLDYILKFGVDYFDEDIEVKWKKLIGISWF